MLQSKIIITYKTLRCVTSLLKIIMIAFQVWNQMKT